MSGEEEGDRIALTRQEMAGDRLLAHVGDQGHEPGPLDGIARCPLERRAVAAPLSGEHLALVGAELLEQADVLVIDVRRTRAAFRGAEPAAILPVSTKSFPRHVPGVLGRTPKSPANNEGEP